MDAWRLTEAVAGRRVPEARRLVNRCARDRDEVEAILSFIVGDTLDTLRGGGGGVVQQVSQLLEWVKKAADYQITMIRTMATRTISMDLAKKVCSKILRVGMAIGNNSLVRELARQGQAARAYAESVVAMFSRSKPEEAIAGGGGVLRWAMGLLRSGYETLKDYGLKWASRLIIVYGIYCLFTAAYHDPQGALNQVMGAMNPFDGTITGTKSRAETANSVSWWENSWAGQGISGIFPSYKEDAVALREKQKVYDAGTTETFGGVPLSYCMPGVYVYQTFVGQSGGDTLFDFDTQKPILNKLHSTGVCGMATATGGIGVGALMVGKVVAATAMSGGVALICGAGAFGACVFSNWAYRTDKDNKRKFLMTYILRAITMLFMIPAIQMLFEQAEWPLSDKVGSMASLLHTASLHTQRQKAAGLRQTVGAVGSFGGAVATAAGTALGAPQLGKVAGAVLSQGGSLATTAMRKEMDIIDGAAQVISTEPEHRRASSRSAVKQLEEESQKVIDRESRALNKYLTEKTKKAAKDATHCGDTKFPCDVLDALTDEDIKTLDKAEQVAVRQAQAQRRQKASHEELIARVRDRIVRQKSEENIGP